VYKLLVTDCEELNLCTTSVHTNCSFGYFICPPAQSDSTMFVTTQSHMSHGCKIFSRRTKWMFSGFLHYDDNGPSILDPPKWTKGGASIIRGCHGGAFGVNFHLYLNLSSRFPTAGLSEMFEAEL
jgi:hypothetical protein